MPPVRNTRSSERDPLKEDCIQTAKRELKQGIHKSLRTAASANDVSCAYPYFRPMLSVFLGLSSDSE